jgi:RAB protein geranylgeranyltransferase component A
MGIFLPREGIFLFHERREFISFELQKFSLKQDSVTRILWSVMFCCDLNVQTKESIDNYNNFVYQVEVHLAS